MLEYLHVSLSPGNQATYVCLFLDAIVSDDQSVASEKKRLENVTIDFGRVVPCLQYTCAAEPSHPPSPNDR